MFNKSDYFRSLANKILVTGKSVNYLREVCQDNSPIKGREELKQCLLLNSKFKFNQIKVFFSFFNLNN